MINRRVAVFQYQWALTSSTVNMVKMLAAHGYAVDLFLCNSVQHLVDFDQLAGTENVHVFSYHIRPRSLLQRLLARGRRLLARGKRPGSLSAADFIDRETFSLAAEEIEKNRYGLFIGVEKKGLLWAAEMAAPGGVPYIYYSLELYVEDHPLFQNDAVFARLRELEIAAHNKALATVIQDPFRAEVMRRYNNMENMQTLYLPISVWGRGRTDKSSFLHERLHITPDKKIILYFGKIDPGRFCREIIRASATLSSDYVVVLHGYGRPDVLEEIRQAGVSDQLLLSLDLVGEECIPELIASAHIGLLFYDTSFSNDALTAFSSEKMALYCRAGVPVISFTNACYQQLYEEFRCGEGIACFDDFSAAVARIDKEYAVYRTNALQAHEKYFDFAKNFTAVLASLEQMLADNKERM